MMQFVTGDGVGQSAGGNLLLVGNATAGGGFGIEIPEEVQSRPANVAEFGEQIGQRALAKPSVGHVVVLLEAFDGSLVSAGDAQGAVAQNALGVREMAHNFLYAPLLRGIAKVGPRGASRAEQGGRLRELLLQRG